MFSFRHSGNRFVPFVAAGLVAALAVTSADVVTVEPAVAAPVVQQPAVGQPLERAGEQAALVTARLTGKNVKITGLTTATSEAIALPSGAIESTVYAAPVRVRGADGWVPVDLTLRRNSDGSITPVVAVHQLTLSGARTTTTGVLASVGVGDARVSIGWAGKLPEPVLNGPQATYIDVVPGIDLVVQATRSGVEQFVVVKSRAAATRVATLSFPLTGKGASSYARDSSGGLVLKNPKGRVV